MLTIDEMIAPADAEPESTPFYFERLRGRLRLDILPMSIRNQKWWYQYLLKGLREDTKAEEEQAKVEAALEAGAVSEAAGEAAIVDLLSQAKANAHAQVDEIAEALIGGWAVQEVEGGEHTPRPYTPELGKEFLHKLIEVRQGMREWNALSRFLEKLALEEVKGKKGVDPTATAGNSSGG